MDSTVKPWNDVFLSISGYLSFRGLTAESSRLLISRHTKVFVIITFERNMQIRKTSLKGLEVILMIYESTRQFMIETVNPTQWKNVHHEEKIILEDIENNNHFVCVDKNQLN